jgi:hypothetical protein
MKQSRLVVLAGALGALALMTVLSGNAKKCKMLRDSVLLKTYA